MKFSHFLTLVFTAAALIVGGVYLSHDDHLTLAGSTDGEILPPDHYFLSAKPSDARIDCPMARDSKHPDPWSREFEPCWLVDGWAGPHRWGSWATAPVSRVEFNLQTTAAASLVIRARANENLPEHRKQGVTVSVNGTEIGHQRVRRSWTVLRFHVPEDVLRIGLNSVRLEFDDSISPAEAGTGKDYRRLAAGIDELTLMAPAGGNGEESGKNVKVDIWNEDRQTLVVGEPGVLVLPRFIPAGTERIELAVRASMSVDSSKIRALLAAEDLDGGSIRKSEMTFPPGRSLSTARLPVGDLAGRWAVITIDTAITTGNLEISKMKFVPGDDQNEPATTMPPAENTRPQPDIVFITLDAARADRFSFAGNDRPTTPVIDDLATESLVFPNAYSLVPYTLCSVPTMITGLSFIDHQVVGHQDVLSQDAVTLAESLQAAGYHTAAFSATPNNSSAKGFDQGYDVFREIWTEKAKRSENRRAHFIAQQVVDWLDTLEDDHRPLHLQVHMVPPHAPYDPPAPFDLFTDPAYDGPCDGYHRTLSAIDGGAMEPTAACLDHLLALYDGNLRAADDAVGTILEALRKRPQWRNTVVLITSDHGEAFYEHGRMDHNSTLYSEMLHVPFVLRLPPEFDASAIDKDQLVTLADLTPTLQSAAGLKLPHSADSRDLLAPNPVPDGRFMVSQTATDQPIRGIRTLRWNLMVGPAGSGALFDVTVDPDERINRRFDHPEQFVGLGKILANRYAIPPQLVVAAETADITEEERILLETLGYIH
jgi:arylsulfatase A-like enzyme